MADRCHPSAGRWSLRISSIYLDFAQAGYPLANSQWRERKEGKEGEGGEKWSAQFGMPFPACEDGARSFKGHTSKHLHRSGTLCTLISFEKTEKGEKRGEGRKVHRLTRGSIRLAVVATKNQTYLP